MSIKAFLGKKSTLRSSSTRSYGSRDKLRKNSEENSIEDKDPMPVLVQDQENQEKLPIKQSITQITKTNKPLKEIYNEVVAEEKPVSG